MLLHVVLVAAVDDDYAIVVSTQAEPSVVLLHGPGHGVIIGKQGYQQDTERQVSQFGCDPADQLPLPTSDGVTGVNHGNFIIGQSLC